MSLQGEELRALRKQAGLTQAEAADLIAVSQPFLGLMERNKKPIQSQTERLVDAVLRPRIDVTYSDGLGGWVVSIARPLPGKPGRSHSIVGKFETESGAAARAKELASSLEGARILVHGK